MLIAVRRSRFVDWVKLNLMPEPLRRPGDASKMNLYRIILNDNLGMGRGADETFASLADAEIFVNSLDRRRTTCLYHVRSNEGAADGRFRTVERYTVWNN